MISRREFKIIAHFLHKERKRLAKNQLFGVPPEYEEQALRDSKHLHGFDCAVRAVYEACTELNPRFNEEKFLNAVERGEE